ncbi:restriction endonuclease subunit S [Petrotoga sp. 8T1HF07.NaAc.6.1]|uniref:restriction endonuclease subunit S n=1 Tax=Petrotoga sp. 8T1HF07.NaAc.6.1 TaxID=1351838 RepID=UPI00192C9B08|nr:restriction endonuclease subunit S [Petrotoga sp. 8T1HF07.NaAc.6.1]
MELDLNQKEEYKKTELGLLPNEWEVVRLGDVVQKMKAGGTPKRGIKEYWNGEIPFALIEDITSCGLYLSKTKNTITEEGLKNSNAWIVPENSLLLSMYATIGETAINTIPLATNQAILAIIPKGNFDKVFGAYLLKFNAERLKMQNIQSTQKNVNKGIVESFKIPVPPLSEQKKIAYVLSIVQEAKEKTEDVIKATKELKKSMMKYLFTYGPVSLEEIENIPLKETEIGLIPEEWEVVRLGDYLELLRNGITKKQNKEGRGLPVSRIETISSGKINPQKVGYIEGLTEQEIKKYKLHEGDILFSHINSEPYLGNSAIYENEPFVFLHGMNLLMLRVKADLLNPWFLNFLISFYRRKGVFMGIASRAVNQSSINQGRLKLLLLPLPPLSEQKKIASILSAIDQKIEAEESMKKALEDLFKSLLHNLMTAKIRVNHLENVFDE